MENFGSFESGGELDLLKSQYEDASKVRARFLMYLLEPDYFDPDLEIANQLLQLQVPTTANFLDIGASDCQFSSLLSECGFSNGRLLAVEPHWSQFKAGLHKNLHLGAVAKHKLQKVIDLSHSHPELDLNTLFEFVDDLETEDANNVLRISGNANSLPINNGSIDVVTANNMLYHLEDIDGAILEAKHALKPGGIFIASTSGAENKLEHRLDEAEIASIMSNITGVEYYPPTNMNTGYTTELSKTILPRFFKYVYMHEHSGHMVVNDDMSKDIYRKSLLSLRNMFKEEPDELIFESALNIVIGRIPKAGKLVKVCRSVAFCSDNLLAVDPKRYNQITN